MVSAASADSIFVSNRDNANPDNLHVFNYSSDGTLSSNKLKFADHNNGSGAFVDPYDTSSIYVSGAYRGGSFHQVQICKLDADLSSTTPIWNKQTNFSVNVRSSSGAPVITENYIWQHVKPDTSVTDGTTQYESYIVQFDKDGTKQTVLKPDVNQSGETGSNSTQYFDVSLDETRLAYIDITNTGDTHLCYFDLSDNSRVWHRELDDNNTYPRQVAIDNSDNGVIACTYDATYAYLEKYSATGSFVWKTRLGPDSGGNTIVTPQIYLKPDGSEGIVKVNNTRTDDYELFIAPFNPSNGTMGSKCTRITGSYNRFSVDCVAPLLIGDRAYVTSYIYNTNGGTTFENMLIKLDTDFADSATIDNVFQNRVVITGNLTTSTEMSVTSQTNTSTSLSTATLSTVTSSLFFETAGPSNISSSTLTPTKYEWRS